MPSAPATRRPPHRGVPSFALYGETGDAASAGGELLHIEPIASRSRLYQWEIDAHVHRGLYQVVWVQRGRAEVHLDEQHERCEAPAAIVIPPGVVHAFRFAPETDGVVLTMSPRSLVEGDLPAAGEALHTLFAAPRVLTFDVQAAEAQRTAAPRDLLLAEFRAPGTAGAPVPVATVAACAGLAPEAVLTAAHPPLPASVGNPFVIAEVGPAALAAARPDLAAFERARAARPEMDGRFALYLYARAEGASLRARMFAPLSGTWEDAATGSAAAPLAGLLLSLGAAPEGRWQVAQGAEMGRPSLLSVSARRTPEGIRATVGGRCVPVLRGEAVL